MLGLAYDGGAYDVIARHALAVAVWWAIAWLVVLRLAPREPFGGWGLVSAGFLTAFALFTGLSTVWSASAERAFLEFDRAALYLGVFVLALLLTRMQDVAVWCDGLALGISAVAVLALVSRLFPGHLGHPSVIELLPGAGARLTYPVDYWNGLGILLALGLPLLLRAAIAAASPLVQGAALLPVPGIAAAIYLTSTRGGVAAALVGSATFIVLTGHRWRAVAAVTVAAAGSVGAIAVLVTRDTLVNGPVQSSTAATEGHSAALWISLLSLATAAVFAALNWSPPRVRVPASAGWLLAGGTAIALLTIVVASHPVRRFDEFKQPPGGYTSATAHLLSGRGNGRWQFWDAAIDEFRTQPLRGRGAGSWEAWWTQHASITYFTRYAHSLYLQILGELGLIGLLLLAAAFVSAFAGAILARLRAPPADHVALAGAAGAFAGYGVGAAVDWMWELTVVSIVGIASLGLLARLASAPGSRPSLRRPALPIAIAAVFAVAIACAEALPMATELKIRSSQDAAGRGEPSKARSEARDAQALEPWAASTYLQLALVYERAGRLAAARSAIDAATRRDTSDWRVWLVSARIAAKQGDVAAARASLERARELNPRSLSLPASAP